MRHARLRCCAITIDAYAARDAFSAADDFAITRYAVIDIIFADDVRF